MIISDKDFENCIPTEIFSKKKWVIGVSGGADSLCLVLLADIYAKNFNIDLVAVFVDHKLREESSSEIIPIINIFKAKKINYEVLIWKHEEKIEKNMEKKAREARYSLLYNFCKSFESDVLMTAHHNLDQWETFFMRLSRGSSLTGLSCMRNISNYKDICIFRPLLKYSPESIKKTLKKRFNIEEFVNDPSNHDLVYERVRWRKSYQKMKDEYGLSAENIALTINRLQKAEKCLEIIADEKVKKCFDGEYINLQIFKSFDEELQMRVLRKTTEIVLQKDYKRLVSYSLLEKTASQIISEGFKSTNIAGCIFRKDKTKNIKIFKENRKEKFL